MLLFCGTSEIDCGFCKFSLFFNFYGLATSGSGESSLFLNKGVGWLYSLQILCRCDL